MATTLQGFVYDNAGNPISGATVQGYVSADEASVTAGDPTTTDTNGKWTITTSDPTHIPMDIKITYGSNVRWLKGYDKTSLTDISVGNIALDSISADDTDINIAVSDNSATALTVKQGTDSYLIVDTADGSESVSIGTGIAGTSVTLGNATSEVTVAGNLTVSGTQTVVNTVTMNATNAVVFEGATADDFETTLTIEDPTADRTVVIPNVSGTIPILAADSDTAITATPTELNLLDGDTAVGGSIDIEDTDGFVVNDGGVMKTIPALDISDYVGDTDTTYTAGALLDLTGTQFDVDLTEAAEAAIADGDYILFLDGGATGTQSKEAVHDLATLFAGTGLTATSSVLAVDSSQTQINAVGTIGTGTWEATDIGVEHGGTGVSSFTDAGVLIGNGTGAIQVTSAGTSGQVLTSNGAGVDPTFQDAGGSVDLQTFTSSGTWTKPAGATMVMVELIGGGGGGASGRKGAAGSTRNGGGGAGSSAVVYHAFAASELSSTETVTVGAGGTGGASVTTNSTNGNLGTDGGTSIFASTVLATCVGGKGDYGSYNSAKLGSGQSSNTPYSWGHFGAAGGRGEVTTTPKNGDSGLKNGGGGAGGLMSSGNTEYPGGDGGAASASYANYLMTNINDLAGASGGAVGANGSNATASSGSGGGGGGASHTGDAGSGGNGASPGGGGGGGGASTDSVGNSGAGGNGGDGRVRVWTW